MRGTVRNRAVVGTLVITLAATASPALATPGTGHAAQQHRFPRPPSESPEHVLIHWVNLIRQHARMGALAPAADLTAVAHRHSAHMARIDRVFHDSFLGSEVQHWLSLGEDVGSAASLRDLEQALLSTAANRANLLGPGFRQIGVGVSSRDGLLYVTVISRRPDGSARP